MKHWCHIHKSPKIKWNSVCETVTMRVSSKVQHCQLNWVILVKADFTMPFQAFVFWQWPTKAACSAVHLLYCMHDVVLSSYRTYLPTYRSTCVLWRDVDLQLIETLINIPDSHLHQLEFLQQHVQLTLTSVTVVSETLQFCRQAIWQVSI